MSDFPKTNLPQSNEFSRNLIPWNLPNFYKRSIALVKQNPKLLLLAVASIVLTAGSSNNLNLGNNSFSDFSDLFEDTQSEQEEQQDSLFNDFFSTDN